MSAQPTRWWGWHRLADEWALRLVRSAMIQRGDVVLDIGAGHGAITTHLVRAGAYVVAVDLNPQRLAHLRQTFADDPVRVVKADVTRLRLPRQSFVVVSNPPFATTTAVLKLLLAPNSAMTQADLVVPRHVAARWSDGRGANAAEWQHRFTASVSMRVPRTAFHPPAPDDAAVLSLRPTRRRANRR